MVANNVCHAAKVPNNVCDGSSQTDAMVDDPVQCKKDVKIAVGNDELREKVEPPTVSTTS